MDVVFLGADHGGYSLKSKIIKFLDEQNIGYVDLGAYTLKKTDDFVDYAFAVGEQVNVSSYHKGILICTSGVGMCIAANKVPGVRAVRATDMKTAKISRIDNDTNVLCLPGKGISFVTIKKIVKTWLTTKKSSISRYKKRNDKIIKYEESK